jgi:hypothetical protein
MKSSQTLLRALETAIASATDAEARAVIGLVIEVITGRRERSDRIAADLTAARTYAGWAASQLPGQAGALAEVDAAALNVAYWALGAVGKADVPPAMAIRQAAHEAAMAASLRADATAAPSYERRKRAYAEAYARIVGPARRES